MRTLPWILLPLLALACSEAPAPPYDPSPVGEQLPQVVAALQAGQPDQALARLDALEAPPEGHQHFRAVALMDAGRPAEALPVLEAELAARPGNGAARLMLAEALLALGRVDEAPPHLEEAARLMPESPYRQLVAGRVALARDDDAGARAAFEAYLRFDPVSVRAAEAHHALGQLATRAGDPQRATAHAERSAHLEQTQQYLNAFRQRLAEDPEDAEAILGVGMVYLDLVETLGPAPELLGQAEAAFKRHVQLVPGAVRAWFNLGYLATLRGDDELAFALYERTLELDPDHVGARLNAGTRALQLGQLERAGTWLTGALELADDDGERVRARLQLGLLAQARGQAREAAEQFRAGLALVPGEPRLTRALAALEAGGG